MNINPDLQSDIEEVKMKRVTLSDSTPVQLSLVLILFGACVTGAWKISAINSSLNAKLDVLIAKGTEQAAVNSELRESIARVSAKIVELERWIDVHEVDTKRPLAPSIRRGTP